MGKFIDLTGHKFGKLTVIGQAESIRRPCGVKVTMWNCQCECGNIVTVSVQNLNRGMTKSCGCLQKEQATVTCKSRKKTNVYDLTKDFGIGYTSNNDCFYFDLEDYDKIKEYCWYSYGGYIKTKENDTQKTISLHRFLMSPAPNQVVDHINHIPQDNRKNNLRICTQRENVINHKRRKDNTSGKTGVSYNSTENRWIVHIKVGDKIISKSFKNKEDAIQERIKLEQMYYKEFVNQEGG